MKQRRNPAKEISLVWRFHEALRDTYNTELVPHRNYISLSVSCTCRKASDYGEQWQLEWFEEDTYKLELLFRYCIENVGELKMRRGQEQSVKRLSKSSDPRKMYLKCIDIKERSIRGRMELEPILSKLLLLLLHDDPEVEVDQRSIDDQDL
ncbi:hypothetical protein SDJN02_04575, partial [Cucurbita argyrosperma subsp. argyrosperma]